MIEKFNFSSKAKTTFITTGALGLVLIIIGVATSHGETTRFWANYLLCNFYFLAFSIIAVTWMGIQYLAKASWATVLKRIPEAMSGYMIVGIIATLVFFLSSFVGDRTNGIYSVYIWSHTENASILNDKVLTNQRPLLNVPMFIIFSLVVLGIFYMVRTRLRNNSLREDREGGINYHRNSHKNAAWFVPFFGLSYCVLLFMWFMSIEPKWFSTMFAVNMFIGGFVSTITTIVLIATLLKKNKYMNYVNNNHFHDLGKFMFGFSIFWVYTWLAQFLLIWYANMPKETIYFITRMQGPWLVLFWCNLSVNFFMPFLALMMRESKRQYSYLVIIGCLMLIGRYIDWYLIVMPGSAGRMGQAGFGFYEIGFFLLFASMFAYTVCYKLAKANLVPMQHPFLQESLHHEI